MHFCRENIDIFPQERQISLNLISYEVKFPRELDFVGSKISQDICVQDITNSRNLKFSGSHSSQIYFIGSSVSQEMSFYEVEFPWRLNFPGSQSYRISFKGNSISQEIICPRSLILIPSNKGGLKKVESSTNEMKCDLPIMKQMLLDTGLLIVIKLLHQRCYASV